MYFLVNVASIGTLLSRLKLSSSTLKVSIYHKKEPKVQYYFYYYLILLHFVFVSVAMIPTFCVWPARYEVRRKNKNQEATMISRL